LLVGGSARHVPLGGLGIIAQIPAFISSLIKMREIAWIAKFACLKCMVDRRVPMERRSSIGWR
jgi:hypothetical protein